MSNRLETLKNKAEEARFIWNCQ